jgi:hypothetical protein
MLHLPSWWEESRAPPPPSAPIYTHSHFFPLAVPLLPPHPSLRMAHALASGDHAQRRALVEFWLATVLCSGVVPAASEAPGAAAQHAGAGANRGPGGSTPGGAAPAGAVPSALAPAKVLPEEALDEVTELTEHDSVGFDECGPSSASWDGSCHPGSVGSTGVGAGRAAWGAEAPNAAVGCSGSRRQSTTVMPFAASVDEEPEGGLEGVYGPERGLPSAYAPAAPGTSPHTGDAKVGATGLWTVCTPLPPCSWGCVSVRARVSVRVRVRVRERGRDLCACPRALTSWATEGCMCVRVLMCLPVFPRIPQTPLPW